MAGTNVDSQGQRWSINFSWARGQQDGTGIYLKEMVGRSRVEGRASERGPCLTPSLRSVSGTVCVCVCVKTWIPSCKLIRSDAGLSRIFPTSHALLGHWMGWDGIANCLILSAIVKHEVCQVKVLLNTLKAITWVCRLCWALYLKWCLCFCFFCFFWTESNLVIYIGCMFLIASFSGFYFYF